MDEEEVVYVYSGMLSAVPSCFCHVWVCATLGTVAHQALLSTGFSRQEYWGGLPCPSPGDLPNSGIEPASLMSPALVGRFFTTVKYYTTIKNNEIMPFAATWMDLEIIILSEVSQRQISYYTTYIWNLRKRYKQTYLQNENNRTDRKQIYGYQRERVVGGRIN